ncbi:hypothetical protein ACF07T_32970 [Streptomyces sp. NPDC015184]|uniref:hypothetical protein n=1 Tax=Streptomyces sp. NPDC015184 TaxID=3364946 RepID=UPI0036F7FE00
MSAADRLALLRRAVRDDRGEWTTHRVQELYRSREYAAPFRRTARQDLAVLARQGLLVLDDTDRGRRVFRPARPSGGSS